MDSLAILIQDRLRDYLSLNYIGAYKLLRSFSLDDYDLPAITFGTSKLVEYEANTGVFMGILSVAVVTQIDETSSDMITHDRTVSNIYDLLLNGDFMSYVNSHSTGHLWSLYNISQDQDRQDRALISLIEVNFHAQLMSLNSEALSTEQALTIGGEYQFVLVI